MRNLKKLLAVLLALCVVLTFTVPAFAADEYKYSTEATKLNTLQLYLGTGAVGGEFKPDLGATLTRQDGIALVVRLMGKEADAKAMTAADIDKALSKATDLKDVSDYAKPYLAYAVNATWYKGTSANPLTLAPKGSLLGKHLAAYILRAMGYSVEADAAIAMLVEKKGIIADQGTAMGTKEMKRDDAVGMMFGSLQATYADGKKVIDKLVETKAVDEAKAKEVGVYTPAVTAKALDVSSAVAINSKIIEVALGTAAVAADLTGVTVKDSAAKDVAVSKVEFAPWATDGKVLLVTLGADTAVGSYYTLTAGTKSVNFGGKAADTTAPTVSSVDKDDYNVFTVTFSEPILLGGTITAALKYSPNTDLKTSTIEYVNSSKVKVTNTVEQASSLYAVAVKGFKDLAGNTMTDDTAKTFVGVPKDTAAFGTPTITPVDSTSAKVDFNKKYDSATCLDATKYTVKLKYTPYTEVKVKTVTADPDGATDTVLLTFETDTVASLYEVTVAAGVKTVYGVATTGTISNTFVGSAKDTTAISTITAAPVSNTKFTLTATGTDVVGDSFDPNTTKDQISVKMKYTPYTELAISKIDISKNIITVTTAAQSAVLYEVTIKAGLKDKKGNATTADLKPTFAGKVVDPKIGAITKAELNADGNILTVTFDQSAGSTLTDVSHYSISDGVGYPTKAYADDATVPDAKVVKLVVPKTIEGKIYTLTVKGLENADGVAMDAAGITGTFVGKGITATLPAIQAVFALNAQTIKVYFDRDVTDTSIKGASKIWNGNALNTAVLQIAADGTTYVDLSTYVDAPLATTYVYQDSVDKNALIIRTNKAAGFDSTTATTTDDTYKLKGVNTNLILPTSSAATVLIFPYSNATASDVSIASVQALNRDTIRVYFDQPVATPNIGFANVATASSQTFATAALTLATVASVDGTNGTAWDFKLSGSMTANGSHWLIVNPAITLAGGLLTDVTGTKIIKDEDTGTNLVQHKREFAGSTTAPAKITSIAAMMTDKRTIEVYFPEKMGAATAADFTKYAINSANDGAVGTQLATQPILKADLSSDGLKVTLHLGADIAPVSRYYLVISSLIANATGSTTVDATKTLMTGSVASGVVIEFAASTTACSAAAISSVALDDDMLGMTITMNQPVAFSADTVAPTGVPDVALTIGGAVAIANSAFPITGSTTPAFTTTIFNRTFAIYGQLLGDTTEGALAVSTVTRNADGTSFHVTFPRALKASTSGYVTLKPAAVNAADEWIFNISNVAVDKTTTAKTTFGVPASALYDNTRPLLATASYVGGTAGADTITLASNAFVGIKGRSNTYTVTTAVTTAGNNTFTIGGVAYVANLAANAGDTTATATDIATKLNALGAFATLYKASATGSVVTIERKDVSSATPLALAYTAGAELVATVGGAESAQISTGDTITVAGKTIVLISDTSKLVSADLPAVANTLYANIGAAANNTAANLRGLAIAGYTFSGALNVVTLTCDTKDVDKQVSFVPTLATPAAITATADTAAVDNKIVLAFTKAMDTTTLTAANLAANVTLSAGNFGTTPKVTWSVGDTTATIALDGDGTAVTGVNITATAIKAATGVDKNVNLADAGTDATAN